MCLEMFHRILDHWCINPERQVSQVTEFCTVEYKMFSKIIAFVGLFRTKVNIISHAPIRKRQITVRLSGLAGIVGSQGGTGFMSPFGRPKFGDGA
jgi:hypothetical protein